eukprot:GHVU01024125.1.p1 GENE.GHVU01024125.1~~GHVU01024125.1.p1  ORF type:complete len:120 (+),score=7.01 GHVU01024125.1:127-486(+)
MQQQCDMYECRLSLSLSLTHSLRVVGLNSRSLPPSLVTPSPTPYLPHFLAHAHTLSLAHTSSPALLTQAHTHTHADTHTHLPTSTRSPRLNTNALQNSSGTSSSSSIIIPYLGDEPGSV